MELYTLDEARVAIVESSAALLHRIRIEPPTLRRLLCGERRGAVGQLDPANRALVVAHRALLDGLRDQGYGWAVDDELDGICSAVFADDGTYDPAVVMERAALAYLTDAAA
jgi:hypothetical protein